MIKFQTVLRFLGVYFAEDQEECRIHQTDLTVSIFICFTWIYSQLVAAAAILACILDLCWAYCCWLYHRMVLVMFIKQTEVHESCWLIWCNIKVSRHILRSWKVSISWIVLFLRELSLKIKSPMKSFACQTLVATRWELVNIPSMWLNQESGE